MAAARFPITELQIDQLVRAFYTRVRKDVVLGPVFRRAVGTSDAAWREHEARIASFWRNALGLDRSFSGNPMMTHLNNSDVVPEQFPVWLSLFRETADDILPPQAAQGISELAERIGKSLAMGLMQFRAPEDPPPLL
ncbi:Group 3 truncated hemoglobin ctb [Tritonibacter multivorans]|uniref:Group 3 truncated hemoglobin ctb n=1 Tax=Tritonibacter multivorans TaxID=928856 RepID=A0A0P1GAG5_9RHOB|nr:group III truncated hemoglobin [Tritonibacter multivorans]MDA7422106.1 group III truncated hemoglobin [Tritonibacter multivorans]CUH78458.1 Group 3 truncated hemoglobin ctb [Tritonibacter multivorans]SFD17179.1 hemoglobin [Tritonibacter multivorans]